MLHRVQLPKHYVANVNHRTARPECFTVSIVLSHALTYSTRYGQPVDTGEPPRPPHQQSAAGTLHVSYIMKTTLIPRRTHRQPPAKLAASHCTYTTDCTVSCTHARSIAVHTGRYVGSTGYCLSPSLIRPDCVTQRCTRNSALHFDNDAFPVRVGHQYRFILWESAKPF